MISIIIPSYKSENYLDLCLYSIFKGEKNKDKNEIIVILDGFVEQSKYVIEKYKEHNSLKIIAFEKNTGFQYAVNTGVWNASSEKIFIVNSDNVFPENWDLMLENMFLPNTIFTIQQIEPGIIPVGFDFIAKDFGRTAEMFKYKDFVEYEKNIRMPSLTNNGLLFPFLISKITFMKVGGFDLYYQSPNVCDLDFFLKLEFVKVRQFRSHTISLYHFGQKSTKNQDNISDKEKQNFLDREQLAYQQFFYKWGFLPKRGINNSLLPNNNIKGINFK